MTHAAHRAAKRTKISRSFSTAREMVYLPGGPGGHLLQHGQTFTRFGFFNRTRSRARTPAKASRPRSSQSATRAGHPDVQLSALASHLPTPRATGRVERPATGNSVSFPDPRLLSAVCL